MKYWIRRVRETREFLEVYRSTDDKKPEYVVLDAEKVDGGPYVRLQRGGHTAEIVEKLREATDIETDLVGGKMKVDES